LTAEALDSVGLTEARVATGLVDLLTVVFDADCFTPCSFAATGLAGALFRGSDLGVTVEDGFVLALWAGGLPAGGFWASGFCGAAFFVGGGLPAALPLADLGVMR
jgi:hypothetical protein